MSEEYAHLIHIKDHAEVALYELIPDVVWIFDLDKHGWWWGNSAALKFWGLETLDQLINKDLSGDTQGAKDRTAQTFELAAQSGLTIDPWTTYPNGKPKTLFMRHRAVLVGPQKHRAIIAFINEEVNLGETPENLLLVEAMRYTSVLVTSFTFAGDAVVENPAATEAYKHIQRAEMNESSFFVARFFDQQEGQNILADAIENKGGQWTTWVNTSAGKRRHTLDIRITRHPLTGDFLLLMSEYDVTALHEAIDTANAAQEKLRQLAHYDPVTGLASMHYLLDQEAALMARAKQQQTGLSLLYLDLDGFKAINDACGHEAGNQVLKTVAKRLSMFVAGRGCAVRVGGDEFVLWLEQIDDRQQVETLANELIKQLLLPIELNGSYEPVSVGASIGVAHYPEHGDTLDGLIQAADRAMYYVKHHGKCGVKRALISFH